MNYKDDKNSGSRGSTALLVLAGLVLFALWCQISDTSVNNELRDLYSVHTGQEHGFALSQAPTRRIGAVASQTAGDSISAAFNATTVPAWCPAGMPLLAITCSTNEPLYRIIQWIRYHQMIGFSLFYFFVEGKASEPEVVDALRQLVGVKVFMQDEKLKWWHVRDRSRHEHWLRKFFGQPCNGELFVKQSINMAVAVHQARVDGAAWIGHIDTDELLYPASTPDYSMHQLLDTVPMEYHSLVLPNYEALPEREGIVEPAREVTLFKVAVDHIDRVLMQQHYKGVAHGNPNYFIAYSNGKSLARVLPGLRPHGAHRWSSYNGTHNPFTHQQASVLHYTYNRFSDLTGRKDRCECAPTDSDARRCFWLSFDQQAFVAASLKTEDELRKMFRDRLVWEDAASIALLRSKGLLTRIYGPQLMIRSEASRLMQSVPRRPSEKVAQDTAIRAQASMQHPFAFAEDTMAGPPTNCAEYLSQDSSLNVLELMGPLPEPDDKTDSDATLIARMTPMYDRQEHERLPVVQPPPT